MFLEKMKQIRNVVCTDPIVFINEYAILFINCVINRLLFTTVEVPRQEPGGSDDRADGELQGARAQGETQRGDGDDVGVETRGLLRRTPLSGRGGASSPQAGQAGRTETDAGNHSRWPSRA